MSIEEKYDEVRQLINIGKEKGYLLYDEVNELLPSEITSSEELELDLTPGALDKTNDPVRMYLREMGTVPLLTREVFQVARSLHRESVRFLPSALIQRLSTMNAQLVTRIATDTAPPAKIVSDCIQALKRLRFDRERAEIQREIDRLQELGAPEHSREIDALWQRKKDLLYRIED